MDIPEKINADQAKLQEDIERLQKLNEEYLDGWKRAKADYINMKRDVEKEKMEIVQFANAGLLLELMPIYDHFKIALKHVPEASQKEAWVEGFKHIAKQMKDFLKNMGVEEISTEGKDFNPEQHEAVSKEKKEGVEPGKILEERHTGFTLQGKVIRPAKVTVSA
jgi:molecular chaperone GrpE